MPDRILPLSAPGRAIEGAAPSALPLLFARTLARARSRRQGALSAAQAAALGPVQAAWRGLRADPRRVARYRSACAQLADGTLPAVWVESLFLGPMAAVVLSDAFPFSPLGLIHRGQSIRVERPLRPDETLDAVARLAAVRETGRGYEIDFALEIHAGGERPWSGLATLLSRNASTRERTRRDEDRAAPPVPDERGWHSDAFAAPADIGRRYAAASGDWNPHHLWPATARLVGYRRPIAHGMWTLGRTLALLERHLARCSAAPWTVEAQFKRPLVLPGRVALRWRAEDSATRFEAHHPDSGEPHLVGLLRPG